MGAHAGRMNSIERRSWLGKHLRIGQEWLYLSFEDCRATGVTEEDIFELTERSLAAHGREEVEMPAKIGLHPQPDSLMHAMPAYAPSEFACGIKWAGNFPTNAERFPDLVATSAVLILNDHESGLPLALMDACWITEVRTPSVSFVAAKHLADPDATTFGMIGCGIQGKAHVRMASHGLPNVEEIVVYDVFESAMAKLIDTCQPLVAAKIRKAASVEDLVKSVQVIASATPIARPPEPRIRDEWVSAGQTLLLNDCHSQVADATVRRADKYVCDSEAQHRILDDYGFYPQGLPPIHAETGEVVAGIKSGRTSAAELIVVNNIGMAVEDVVVARQIFDRALERGIGIKLPLWQRTS